MSSHFQFLLHTRAGQKRALSRTRANQDRVLKRECSSEETGGQEAALLVVADGVSRCPDGGAVAEWIVHEKLAKAPLFLQPGVDLGEQLKTRLLEFRQEFLKTFLEDVLMLESGSTLAVALIYGSRGFALWSGDSPLYLVRDQGKGYSAENLIVADVDPYTGALTDCFSGVTPFEPGERTFQLSPGDIVIAATDGILFNGNDLADTLSEQGFTPAWMDFVCQTSFDSPRSDDLAIVAAQWLGPLEGPVLS